MFSIGTEVNLFLRVKGGIAISLPINKEQFEESILDFINKYKRLPYENEDDIEVEIINNDGEKELRPYKAKRYIAEYYKTQDKLTDVLFEKQIITYKSIGEILGCTETVTRNAITKSVKNPDIKLRRAIHIFFNKDFYKELGEFNGVDDECKKKCKFPYWVDVVRCGVHSKKKS